MATDQLLARDAAIRQAAFDHVRALQDRDLVLTHTAIAQGFWFEGERWPLWNPRNLTTAAQPSEPDRHRVTHRKRRLCEIETC